MCGIYFYFTKNPSKLVELFRNLNKIHHRGHDSYGVFYLNTTTNTSAIEFHKKTINMDIINKEVETNLFLAHLRYRTSGSSRETIFAKQPVEGINKFGKFRFVYNGNIPCEEYSTKYTLDTLMIKDFLEGKDSSVDNWIELLSLFIKTFSRAFSIIILCEKKIYLIKDKYGVRPLSYTFDRTNQTLEICSESVGFERPNNEMPSFHEVENNSIVQFDLANIDSPIKHNVDVLKCGGTCLFEYVYFLSPQTVWNDVHVGRVREEWGRLLAQKETYIKSLDYLVIGIPSTGIMPAKTYAQSLNLPYKQAIIKNKKINRTFILTAEEREEASKQKYIYVENEIKDNKIIILDDSIVRGITMKNIVTKLFQIGAKEVHIRIISPTIVDICKYGIDIPTKEELVAPTRTIEELNSYFGSNSLVYLDKEDISNNEMFKQANLNPTSLCASCFGHEW